ncbi:MAG: hypothetical protein EOM05_00470 [Clostridia bacterium]|nr:hypothetical protein [Clostridia bacterium]
MSRKSSSYDESGGPNWLDTYADMVTLLLTFFVLLFSMSSISSEKWEMLVKSFEGASEVDPPQHFVVRPKDEDTLGEGILEGQEDSLPITSPEDVKEFDDLYEYFKQFIEQNNLQDDVEIFKGDGYTFITFRNNIFFDGNSSVLKSEGKQIIDILSEAFKNIVHQIGKVSFEGHTARSGSAETANDLIRDRQLSSERAVNVLCYAQGKSVIEGQKLTATGHGEFRPIVPHDGTEATRIKNRRVEIYIVKEGTDDLSLDEVYAQINAQQN